VKIRLDLEIEKFGPRSVNVGELHKINEKHFRMRVRKQDTLLDRVDTLAHEWAHLLCWLMFNDGAVAEATEERFCDEMGKATVKAFKRLQRGNE